jgi:cbb3-type cytochrome oxidase subunit 3
MKKIIFICLIIIALIAYAYSQEKKDQREMSKYLDKKTEENKQEQKEAELDNCLKLAEVNRWEYMKLNGTLSENEDGREIIRAAQSYWDYADKKLEEERDYCFKRYR